MKEIRYYDNESQNIVLRFFDLTCSLEDVLEKHTSVDEVKQFISRLLIAPRQESTRSNCIVDDPKEFNVVGTINGVLSFLEEKELVTFYNYKIFELLLGEWCAVSYVKEEFELYRKCLNVYAKRNLKKRWPDVPEVFQDTKTEENQLVLVTDKSWNPEKTLQEVFSLETKVAEIVGIQEFALILRRIEWINECLTLYHYVPKVKIVTILSGEAEKLINQGICTVLCGRNYNLKEICEFG